MEETISLGEIFQIIKKRLALIIAMMFVGLGVAGALTFFVITPKYSSQAQMIVTLPQNASGVTNTNDINSNLLMINTYRDLIVGDAIIEKVQGQLKEDYDYTLSTEKIKSCISVTSTNNSLMFSIVATTTQPQMSERIANVTATVFQTTAKEILNESVDKITISSKAVPNLKQVSPNNKLNLAIGLVIGMMLGIGLAFLLELFDKTVKDQSFIVDELDFIILGNIPNMTTKELSATFRKSTPTPPAATAASQGEPTTMIPKAPPVRQTAASSQTEAQKPAPNQDEPLKQTKNETKEQVYSRRSRNRV